MYDLLLEHQFIIEFSPHTIATSIFILAALLLFVSVAFVRKVWMAATLPIALFIVASTIFTIHNISGQPTERKFRDDFLYLGHTIGSEQDWIYIWGEEDGIGHPITSKIPYSEQLHEELAKAQEQTEDGVQIQGRIKEIVDGEQGIEGEYVFHEFLLDESPGALKPQ